MTGGLVATLPLSSLSPVHSVAHNYSVDSFSEFSTRSVNRAINSPTSGSRSGRAKEEDEELFRDLFVGENDSELNEETGKGDKPSWSASPTFIPQKPVTRRAAPTTGHANRRQNLASMKPAPPQPVLTTPFIPRLKLEELVNARPDDDDSEDDNNLSQRSSRRVLDLEQVTEEDEFCLDDGPNEDYAVNAAPRKTQPLTGDRKFSSSLGFATNNQRLSDNEQLDLETRRFLEKLDLKTVLQTPRPDLLSFYPNMTTTPTTRSLASPHSKTPWITTKQTEFHFEENPKERKGNPIFKEFSKSSKIDVVASRLAYMESMYGTMPIARKTRRETINRLANPFSGHSSTLQALPPKQREKRESALTSRAPLSPMSAAIAVSCRRGTTTKTGKRRSFLGGLSRRVDGGEIHEPTTVPSKRNALKRQDPLDDKRRSNMSTNAPANDPSISRLTKRKSATTLGSRSLDARKEALKKKLQCRSGATKRGGDRKIGGSTFLTQHDDEEGIEQIEHFIAQHRRQASLTFRSGKIASSRRTVPAVSARSASISKSQPLPPQARTGVNFVRSASASKNRGRGSHTTRELQSVGYAAERKSDRHIAATYSSATLRSGRYNDPPKLFSQPRRPRAWQTASLDRGARGLNVRATTPGGAANPLRKLKVHPAMPNVLPNAPKTPPSAATTPLMGAVPMFSLSGAANESKSARSTRRNKKKASASAISSRAEATKYDAPTKQSEQRRRTSTASRSNGADKSSSSRQTFAGRRTSTL